MKIIAAILLCCILSGCGGDSDVKAVEAFQKACTVPLRMDMSLSGVWTTLELHCDKVVGKK